MLTRVLLALGAAALAACSLLRPLDGFTGGDAGASDAAEAVDAAPPGHFLYVIGGSIAEDLFSDNVYYATIRPDGGLGPLLGTTPLPTGLRNHTALIHGDTLYVMGGELTDGSLSAAVFLAPLLADGAIGPWRTLAAGLGAGRRDHATSTSGDFVFLSGGNDGRDARDTAPGPIWRALARGGALGAWEDAGLLPDRTRIHAQVTAGGALIVLGGSPGSGAYSAQVLAYPLGEAGAVGAAVPQAPLPALLGYHRAVLAGESVYVLGGVVNDGRSLAFSSDVYRAAVGSGGTIASWARVRDFTGPRWRHAAVFAAGSLYVVGGREGQSGPFFADVQVGRVLDTGDLEWRTLDDPLPRRLASHAVVAR